MKKNLVLIGLSIVLVACNADKKQTPVKKELEVVKNSKPEPKKLIINENSFVGIQFNDAIANYSDKLMKGKMRTGEGVVETYYIEEDGNELGYVMPDAENENLIGNITIQSKRAETESGVRIGTTFSQLEKIYPEIEVHGSEMESKVYASTGNYHFRLNHNSNQYNLDRSTIPKDSEVTEISISSK